jgi:hypothetical protein
MKAKGINNNSAENLKEEHDLMPYSPRFIKWTWRDLNPRHLSNARYFLSEDTYGKRNPYCSNPTRFALFLFARSLARYLQEDFERACR